MTGYARVEGAGPGFAWLWELKSVNGKALDVRFRLPPGYEVLEIPLKARLAAVVKRGSVTASLTLTEATRAPALRVNEAALDQILVLLARLEGRIEAAPPRLDGLLAIRGVLETVEPETDGDREARIAAFEAGFDQALAALAAMRAAEGLRLAGSLGDRLDEIQWLVAEAEAASATQPDAIRARFRTQVDLLLYGRSPVGDDRLAQEVALLIAKADIREELDRLTAHVAAARELLAEGAGVGRRLDFLCQEFNREANTVCSKSADLGLTRLGLALKAAIEQFREQIQNIE
jgi:uncharacterized protein (TIGR00255 family)